MSKEQPEPEDYILSPAPPLGSRTNVGTVDGRFLGTFPGDDAALAFIRAHMEEEQFWPDVWIMSDHGNPILVTED